MHSRSFFDVDCFAVIPECGFECSKCIEELETSLREMQGVTKVYIEKAGEEQRLVVEHDPNAVTVGELTDTIEGLPSFYEGFFEASVVMA